MWLSTCNTMHRRCTKHWPLDNLPLNFSCLGAPRGLLEVKMQHLKTLWRQLAFVSTLKECSVVIGSLEDAYKILVMIDDKTSYGAL